MGDLVDFLTENADGFRKARLPALYSDFRGQRATNPDGYAANVSAWRRALAAIARSGLAPSSSSTGPPDSLILTTDDSLLRALESRQYGRPLALGVAINEAIAAGDLIPLPQYLAAKQSILARPASSFSLASVPWAVLSWGARQVGAATGLGGGGGVSDKLPKTRLVVLANVEAAAKSFVEKTEDASSRFERTWSKPHFLKTFQAELLPSGKLSAADADVLLTFLSRDKGLSSLRTRFATLSQLEEVAARIEQASDQVQLVKVMATSTDALKGLNSKVGGADAVGDVVDRLREQMDAVDEVSTILAESAGPVVDEDEIDEELAALEGEEKKKEEEKERAKREAEEAKEAEELQRQLEAIGSATEPTAEKEQRDAPRPGSADRDAAVEGIRRLSLEEPLPAQPTK
ncbi:SNF7 family protein [Magnaporthiopsis poae ATCC 64411]|uniref:SNF7 family protein n=1 Tax=Magnaporthiopsis poae (strain ATCC 64411 / 73-15) TaxID=644358 RepID=A0A0C4DM62_MAGP6|nr:SNF7 family protein [Magnaporthiopsis poae ATCC 64411]